MHIGIYGGSFNPIHIAHTSLAQSLLDQRHVDEVWFLVSPLNPLKQEVSADIIDYGERLHLAQLATEDIRGIRISDFETTLPLPSYTITTLDALSAAYPEHTFSLIIGADNWEQFHRWHRWQEILERYSLLIYRRPGYDIDTTIRQEYSNRITIVDAPLYDISSTEIRQAIRDGKSVADWVSPKVLEYIRKAKLYQ